MTKNFVMTSYCHNGTSIQS